MLFLQRFSYHGNERGPATGTDVQFRAKFDEVKSFFQVKSLLSD
jgi:hypothetical protein